MSVLRLLINTVNSGLRLACPIIPFDCSDVPSRALLTSQENGTLLDKIGLCCTKQHNRKIIRLPWKTWTISAWKIKSVIVRQGLIVDWYFIFSVMFGFIHDYCHMHFTTCDVFISLLDAHDDKYMSIKYCLKNDNLSIFIIGKTCTFIWQKNS